MLQFFVQKGCMVICDLPGYGYAKAPLNVITEWQKLKLSYIHRRRQEGILKCVFLCIEAKAGVKKNDHEFMVFLDNIECPFQPVITRVDKLNTWTYKPQVDAIREEIREYKMASPFIHLTSSLREYGTVELHTTIAEVTGLFDRIDKHEEKRAGKLQERYQRRDAMVAEKNNRRQGEMRPFGRKLAYS